MEHPRGKTYQHRYNQSRYTVLGLNNLVGKDTKLRRSKK